MQSFVIRIISAAILCAVMLRINGKCRNTAIPSKILISLFILLTMVQAFRDVNLQDYFRYFENIEDTAASIIDEGEYKANSEIADIINERIASYISSRGRHYGVNLTVQVTAIDSETMRPIGVSICGEVSPYIKKLLTSEIENDLGIPEEDQLWSSAN